MALNAAPENVCSKDFFALIRLTRKSAGGVESRRDARRCISQTESRRVLRDASGESSFVCDFSELFAARNEKEKWCDNQRKRGELEFVASDNVHRRIFQLFQSPVSATITGYPAARAEIL